MPASGFVGERLQLAREFRGLTQKQLSALVASSSPSISRFERNLTLTEPPPDLVAAFGEVLGFKNEFFFRKVSDPFHESECNFRHRRTAPESIKSKVRAHGTLIGEVVKALQSRFKFPSFDVPSIQASSDDEIERAAEECRTHWSLGTDSPITHVGRVLERAGVPILTGIVEARKIDAFSRYGQTTLIFLNQYIQSSSRWAFDLGHECGHLVLHRGTQTGSKETEAEADRFASAFLLPERAFRREFGSPQRMSWAHVFEMKTRWRVSAAAINRRAYDLGIIEASKYRHNCQHISMKGWQKGEPHEPDFQQPELVIPALQALGKTVKTTVQDLCNELGMPHATFRDVTGYAVPESRLEVLRFPK